MLKRKILVTGAAGSIGAALSKRLLENGDNFIGIDNLNSYYDQNLNFQDWMKFQKIYH